MNKEPMNEGSEDDKTDENRESFEEQFRRITSTQSRKAADNLFSATAEDLARSSRAGKDDPE